MIRSMVPGDAPLLAELAARLFRQTYSPHYRPEDVDDHVVGTFGPDRQRAELMEPAAHALLVTAADGTAIGYAQLREGPPSAAPSVVGARALEVVRFYVDQAWHGRGVAYALMSACVAEGERRSADTLWLSVWRENTRAIAFYQRCGFRSVGTQPFRFGSLTEEDYLMARPLGAATSDAGRVL